MKKRKLINRTTYLRSTSNYTAVSNEAARGKLSAGALGLLVLLLANTETFIIHKTEIEKRSGFGETTFNGYWDELVKNGFIYSLKQPKGMFSYHYVIVNEPSHKSNKQSLKEILENHTLFSGDGESQMKNQEPNTKAEKKDTNIALTNKDSKNKDASNKDVFNSTLGIKENPTKTEELTKFWYENIDNTKLSDSEEKEFLTQELFVSVLAQTVSKIKINKSQFEEHPLNIPLKSFYYVFGFTVRDWKYTEKPYTFSNISDEAISFIQKSKKYPNV
jgi:hypothetical protein